MRLYRDGQTVDVQPKYAGRYLDDGWSATPPTSRKPRGPKPDETSGDVSETEGDS